MAKVLQGTAPRPQAQAAPAPAAAAAPAATGKCPITHEEFLSNAQPLAVTINGSQMTAEVKEFGTGSLGWNTNGKTEIEIAGKRCKVQVGVNLTIIGSKEVTAA